jgi:hypothetical protein
MGTASSVKVKKLNSNITTNKHIQNEDEYILENDKIHDNLMSSQEQVKAENQSNQDVDHNNNKNNDINIKSSTLDAINNRNKYKKQKNNYNKFKSNIYNNRLDFKRKSESKNEQQSYDDYDFNRGLFRFSDLGIFLM